MFYLPNFIRELIVCSANDRKHRKTLHEFTITRNNVKNVIHLIELIRLRITVKNLKLAHYFTCHHNADRLVQNYYQIQIGMHIKVDKWWLIFVICIVALGPVHIHNTSSTPCSISNIKYLNNVVSTKIDANLVYIEAENYLRNLNSRDKNRF